MTNDIHSDKPNNASLSDDAHAGRSSHKETAHASTTSEDLKGLEEAKSLKAKILGAKTFSGRKPPPLYRVVLLNDDFTPHSFVLAILRNCFGHSEEKSQILIDEIQSKGSGVGGVYSYEIAETKMDQISKSARKGRYPLQCTLEKIDS